MTCTECGTVNVAGAKFCTECGTAQARPCAQCGTGVTGRFCPECGTPVGEVGARGPSRTTPPPAPSPPVAERRVTSVLFGDLVGFTPLSESRDAEDVRELLSRYFAVARTVITRYGGTVEKFIGDAVMAVWGVPSSHEDDAERAVRAGLDLVDAVAALGDEVGAIGLAARVGIVTGEVAVTLGAAGEGMVAGDPVNTAARIQTAAAAGEVWVDETTRSLTSAAVAYVDCGPRELKGKAEPQMLFAARQVVAAVGGAQRVDGLEAPFVGREREMRLVKELFHATLEERRPRLVAVSGLPGVGKSRLGWEFFKYIDGISDIVRWHRGRCLSYGEGVAFWALAEMVRSRLDILEGDEPAVAVDKLDAGLRTWMSDAEELAWLRPRLAVLLGLGDVVSPGTIFARADLFSSWQLFLERLVDGATGVALLIEDMQWADDGLLDFVEQLLERSSAPIFILTLARPELVERRPGWGSGRRVTPLHLEPLTQQSMAALVDGLVGGLQDVTRVALVERAEGIPLYAVETVRSLIDRDAVVPREGRYVLADEHETALDLGGASAPTSLHTLLAARLDALPPSERAAVQNSAVLGLSFTRAALAALTTATSDDTGLDTTLDALVRKEILALESDPRSPERGQYRFVQAMVRAVAYDTLSRRDRKTRHLLAAAYLAAEPDADSFAPVLASHYLDARAAGPDDDDAAMLTAQAVHLLERAAEHARAVGAPAQAQRHYLRALDCVDDDATTGRLLLGAAGAAVTAGRLHDAAELAERSVAAFDRAGLEVDAGLAWATYGDARNSSGFGADIPGPLEQVYAALAHRADATTVLMRLAAAIARGYFAGRSDAASALPWADRAAAMAEAEEDWPLLTQSLAGHGAILMTSGRPTAGLGLLRVALDVARQHDLPSAQLVPLNNLASFLAARDLAAARTYVEEGLALARVMGDEDTGSYLRGTASFIYWQCGDWDALRLVASGGPNSDDFDVVGAMYDALARRARGEPLAELVIEADDALAPQLAAAQWVVVALQELDAGDAVAGTTSAARALETFARFGGFDDDFPTYWSLALDLAIDHDSIDAAQSMFASVADAPRGQLSPLIRALIPYFRARLVAADGGDAVLVAADFATAAADLAEFGTPYWQARCALDHAGWLTEHGERDEAVPLIDDADRLFTSLRAQPWLERTRRMRSLAVR